MNDDRYLTHLHQVEEWLERPLTNEELAPVTSLDELAATQLAVVKALANRRLEGLIYLRTVVPGVLGNDALALIDRVRDAP